MISRKCTNYLIATTLVSFTVAVNCANALHVDTDKAIFVTDEKFLSVAIDSSVIAERWRNFDFHSRAVISMAKALAPAYLRVGGTAADLLIFREKGSGRNGKFWRERQHNSSCDEFCPMGQIDFEKKGKKTHQFHMSGKDWRKLNDFVHEAGWKMLFDLNVLLRKPSDPKAWSVKNAWSLLDYSSRVGYGNIDFELGNEPNALHHQLNFTLPGKWLGSDFERLRLLLNRFPLFINSSVVGPDVNHMPSKGAFKYLSDVLDYSGDVLDAVTWHQYYLNGHIAKVDDFINHKTLDQLDDALDQVNTFVRKTKRNKAPIWMGETSSAYGGGAPGLSDRYVNGFLWLNKLGAAAAAGQSVVIRQTFYHGHYALIGEDLQPNSDFWVSALYKKLVGRKVLKINGHNNHGNTLRLFAHCRKEQNPSLPEGNGIIVIFGLNMSNRTEVIKIPHKEFPHGGTEEFKLSPSDGILSSRKILLNGKLLNLEKGWKMPVFDGAPLGYTENLSIGPFEMVFWTTFPRARSNICKNS